MAVSIEHALRVRPAPLDWAQHLDTELALTDAHRRHADAHPAVRELSCLQVLFPAVFQPIGDADLFAGRIFYPLVAFGPEPFGLGYNCATDAVQRLMARYAPAGRNREQVDAMLEYWRGRTTAQKCRAAFPLDVIQALPSDAWTEDVAPAFPLYRMGGSVLDYGKLVRLGVPGLKAEIARRQAAVGADNADSAAFLNGLHGALDVFERSLRFYGAQALSLASDCPDAIRKAELARIASACEALRSRAPATFFEACQLIWLYVLHAGTWNYGRMDMYLGPILSCDLDSGAIDEQEALRLLCNWWSLIKAYDNLSNNRVFIGGRGRPDERACDRFALLAIEASRRVRLNQPQLSLRFYKGQNSCLMNAALTALGEGCTFPILYNDDVNVPAVASAFGVPEVEAISYTPFGCGEYVIEHRSFGSPNGVINLAKILELVLHNGFDPIAQRQSGPTTGELTQFGSFEDLWRAYAAQTEYFVAALADQQRIEYDVTGQDANFLFLSALYDDCIARGRPLLGGGVRYLGGTLETYGNITAADALLAIKDVVYDRQIFSLTELVEACDANFEGYSDIHRALLAAPKYGNDDDRADAMAVRVHKHICRATTEQSRRVGLASYLVVIINNWSYAVFGRVTGATTDGRRAGQPLSNANNPSAGMDRNGPTAFLNSLVKLSPALHAGAVQNMKFSKEMFSRHRSRLEALLMGYWNRGGAQAMITVVSAADLKAAIAEPEKWGQLMVRVGGFSAHFVNLPRSVQEDILRRTLYE